MSRHERLRNVMFEAAEVCMDGNCDHQSRVDCTEFWLEAMREAE